MKKILRFLVILLPWFIGGILFRSDSTYYNNLVKPFFAPPGFLFAIIWPILYILIAISIYKVFLNNNFNETKKYNQALLINYFSNQVFSFLFFTIRSPFFALIDTIIVFISSLFLYCETNELDEDASKYLIPYIAWNAFACVLIVSVFFFNI